MCTSSRVHDTSCLFLIKPLVGNTPNRKQGILIKLFEFLFRKGSC
nr:MAG TPA: hypothetical protein [Caudoviricetes sp.]